MKIGSTRTDEPDETGMILPDTGNHEYDDHAGAFLRLLAAFIDILIGLAIYAGCVYVRARFLGQPVPYLTAAPAWTVGSDALPTPDSFLVAIGIELLALLFIYTLYTAAAIGSNWQATPGMRIIGIYVTSVDGYPIGRSRAFARTFSCLLSLLPAGLGLLLAFIGDKSTLHDYICRTRVMVGRE